MPVQLLKRALLPPSNIAGLLITCPVVLMPLKALGHFHHSMNRPYPTKHWWKVMVQKTEWVWCHRVSHLVLGLLDFKNE